MDCWNNLIGISNTCSDTVSDSQLYVNDLTFIDIKTMDAAVTEEYNNGMEVIQKAITNAGNAVTARIRSHLKPNLQILSNLENDTIGFYQDNMVAVAADTPYKGIHVQINDYNYLQFDVHSITLQLDASLGTVIKVFDLITGLQVGTDIPITTVADDLTTVEVNRSYVTNKQRLDLIFVIDSSVAGTYKTVIHKNYVNSCVGCNERYNCRFTSFSGISIPIASQKILSNLTSINGTNGMSMNFTTNCSVDSYICNQGLELSWGVLQRIGIELMRELKYSKRLSSIVNVFNRDITELLEFYEKEYEGFMREYLANLVPPNDFCFKCNQRIKNIVQIP